jgi:amidase
MLAPPLSADVDPVAEQAARDAGVLLEHLGHDVEEIQSPTSFDPMFDIFTDVWAAMVGLGVRFGEMVSGHEAGPDDVEPLTWALHQRALETPSSTYMRSLTILQRVARGQVEWMSQWDVVLTPALAKRPLRVGELDTCSSEPWATFDSSSKFTPYTPFINVSGQPAVSLPLYHGDDGLPLGVQIIGPPLSEGLLLSLAAQLETELPWAARVAPTAP